MFFSPFNLGFAFGASRLGSLSMTTTNRLLVIFNTLLALILVLVLIQFAPSVANAGATTVAACADKKTGSLRIAYKTCSSKENKVSWGVIGPKGATGATGPAGDSGDSPGFVVKDATGAIVENVVSVDLNFEGPGNVVVFKDGVLWNLNLTTGEFFHSNGGSNWFATPDCTGERIAPVDFYRANEAIFDGNWRKTSQLATPGTIYFAYPDGCALAGTPIITQQYFQFTNVTRPSNLPSPLYLRAN
jgi:hypothetical protein